MDIDKSDLMRKLTKNIYLVERQILNITDKILRRSYGEFILANNIYYTEYITTQENIFKNEEVLKMAHKIISELFNNPELHDTNKTNFYNLILKLEKDQLKLLNDYLSSHI